MTGSGSPTSCGAYLGKADNGLVRRYLEHVSGLSRAQMTRLIHQFRETRSIRDRRTRPARRRFTHELMVTLASWARILTWKQVAKLFHCSWSTVEAAVDETVAYGMTHRDLSGVTHIAGQDHTLYQVASDHW